MKHPFCWPSLFCIILLGGFFSSLSRAADCKNCQVVLDIPQNELWQGVQQGDQTIFAMQRGNELFATIEILKFYNEARYSLDQLAVHYQEICNPAIVIAGSFDSRTINGIPVRWGRGGGKAEDGSEFLVHLIYFFAAEDACQLTAVVRKQSKNLYEYLLPEIIESLRPLPAPADEARK